MRLTCLKILFALHFCPLVYGQVPAEYNSYIDSLKNVIAFAKHDSIKVNTLLHYDDVIYAFDVNLDLELNLNIIQLCEKNLKKKLATTEKIFFKRKAAKAHNNAGIIYADMNEHNKALQHHNKALTLRQQLASQKDIAQSYNNMGIVYMNEGNYPEALNCFYKSLAAYDQLKIKTGMEFTYNNIGIVYEKQGLYKEALTYAFKGYATIEQNRDTFGMGTACNNIGNIYHKLNNKPKALEYYFKAVDFKTKSGKYSGIGGSYNNIGSIYFYNKDLNKAVEYHEKAIEFEKAAGDPTGLAIAYNNLGLDYLHLQQYTKARELMNLALVLGKQGGINEYIKNCYHGLAEVDSATGDFRSAFGNYKLYVLYRDSLINEENTKKSVQTQMQYEFDKKEMATKSAQEKKDAIAKAEKERQQLILWLVGGVLILVVVFAVFIFRSLRKTKKQKKIIEIQKQEVELQKHLVEEKQKEILDSIHYAKRIQMALLPNNMYLEKNIGKLNK